MKIGIIGYGSFGKQVEHYLTLRNKNLEFIYFDDTHDLGHNKKSFNSYHRFLDQNIISNYYLGLGYKHLDLKNEIMKHFADVNMPNYIHEEYKTNNHYKIGKGCFIFPNVTIDTNVTIGSGVVINISSTICHDTIIGDCSFIAPNATVCGGVVVGKKCFIGAGAVISNGLKVGDNVTIGAGTIVTRNLDDGANAIGNPVRTVSKLTLE